MELYKYDRDLMEILDSIVRKLQNENLQASEVDSLCGNVFDYHYKALDILVKFGLASKFGNTLGKKTEYIELRKTEELDIFIQGGNTFLGEYLSEKRKRSHDRINKIVQELVEQNGNSIPYLRIKEKTRNDSDLLNFLIEEIEKQGYTIIGNIAKASKVLSNELETIDEVPYSEILSFSKKLNIDETEVFEILINYLGFINIRPGAIAHLQRKNLDINSLYDKLERFSKVKVNREQQTLASIANVLPQNINARLGNLFSYKQLEKILDELLAQQNSKNEEDSEFSVPIEYREKKDKVEIHFIDDDKIKYFNLYISPKRKELQDIIIQVITEEQIYDYFRALKNNQKSIEINSHRKVDVVEFKEYHIYDFSISKTRSNKPLESYEDLLRFYDIKEKQSKGNLLPRFLRNIGIDITSRFSSKIGEILKEKITKTEETSKPEESETESEKINYFHLNPSHFNILDRNLPACFNVDKTANVLAEHLKNLSQNESGQMVGVFGKWGRGKTYFVEKLCEPLRINYREEIGNGNFHFVKFHAWKYQETPASWAYLYETIANKYLGKNEFKKFFRRLCLNIKREKWGLLKDFVLISLVWGMIALLFQIIQIKSTGLLGDLINFFKTNWWQTITGGTVFTSLIKFYQKKGVDALALIRKYTKGVSFDKHLGIQAEIEKELAVLIETWMPNPTQKRLLLFVDDIDRCSDDKIISLIDSLRVMLEHPEIIKRVIVLVAVDEEKLKFAIRKKYDSLLIDNDKDAKEIKLKLIEREYMDKLFISGIKLHPIDDNSKLEFARSLLLYDYQINNEEEYKLYQDSNQKAQDSSVKIKVNSELIDPVIPKINKEVTVTLKETDLIEEENTINPVDLESDLEIWLNSIELSEEELTPRQIRILYYRYKLAKNLLAEYWGDTNSLSEEDLDLLLEKIKIKTFNSEHHDHKTDILSQIAEMVVGY